MKPSSAAEISDGQRAAPACLANDPAQQLAGDIFAFLRFIAAWAGRQPLAPDRGWSKTPAGAQ